MKFLAMHITNQKLSFDIFTVGHFQISSWNMIFTSYILYPNDFWHKIKNYNVDPYNVLLAIATNIPVLLMTGFVLQGHILSPRLQLFDQKYSKTVLLLNIITIKYNYFLFYYYIFKCHLFL